MEKTGLTGLSRDPRGRVLRLLLFAYLLLLLWVLFLQRAETARHAFDDYDAAIRLNLVPFATIDRYVRAIRAGRVVEIAYINLVGNLVLFMPMGVLLPLCFLQFQKPWRFFLLLAALLPAIEAMQLLLRCGCCDVDDVLLNFFGAALAYAVTLPIIKSMQHRRQGRKE